MISYHALPDRFRYLDVNERLTVLATPRLAFSVPLKVFAFQFYASLSLTPINCRTEFNNLASNLLFHFHLTNIPFIYPYLYPSPFLFSSLSDASVFDSILYIIFLKRFF